MTRQERPYKKYFTTSLKMIFVILLLYFLLQKGFISIQAMQRAFTQWDKILLVVFVISIAQVLGVTRWQILLQAQGISLKWLRIMQLALIGNFFNIALPGAVSGDFVKAFYIGKEVQGKRSRAFGSIMFDRVAGLSALVLVSATALLIQFPHYAGSPLVGAIGFFIAIAALCVFIFYSYLFLVQEKHDPVLMLLNFFEKKMPKLGSLTRVYEGLRHYHNHKLSVVKVLILSCFIHVLVGLACLLLGQALGDTASSLLSVLIIVPLGLLIIAVPVAPAGVGTGNIAFLYLFGLIGCDRGADVYSLFALTNIFFGCIGGLVYTRFKAHPGSAQLEEALS